MFCSALIGSFPEFCSFTVWRILRARNLANGFTYLWENKYCDFEKECMTRKFTLVLHRSFFESN